MLAQKFSCSHGGKPMRHKRIDQDVIVRRLNPADQEEISGHFRRLYGVSRRARFP
ncbi:hypothetical protein [Leisingera sp. JC1]|uniref:hypothetical protein n=1 Tax=Leisingera sp. JC1 TaxID=1855282 RepID=UPI001C305855|nr:hypothetical protein [Leisingera sp. JC1]